ncbi:MAG: hypothetical protein RBR48_01710 [Bacilli bacterium]|jgi:hypothetical protein|nr:hypothetical protein [Bacilli bacterium]
MDYTKAAKKIKKDSSQLYNILKIVIAGICLLTTLTMFLPLFKIYGTFTNGFIELMKVAFPDFDFNNVTGLAITTYGFEFAFGVNEVSLSQPYHLVADEFLIFCYMLPLAMGLLLIPFKKLDHNKLYATIKYCVMGMLMVTFGLLFMIYIDGATESFRNMLVGVSTEYGFAIYASAVIKKVTLPILLQLLYIFGGFLCLYLATNVSKMNQENKKKGN